ncbi:MAG: 4-hydroxy-3-methylbut-2-enyl diphosphate reductase [candidate division Zixibacteria bacterium]
MNIYLAKARGFCMGVERSISMAEDSRRIIDGNITILNEIVHNSSVVEDLDRKGILRTTDLNDVNDGTLIISAHGVAPSVIEDATNKGLKVIDSTCPLVTVLHKAAEYFIKRRYTVLVFGDPSHDEMKGVKGRNPDKIYVIKTINSIDDLPNIDGPVAIISQSTQSMEDFDRAVGIAGEKYSDLKIKNTICDATRKRQTAVVDLAPRVDIVIVVGSQTSANSRRLALISEKSGTPAYLIDDQDEIDPNWLDDKKEVGITAGASTPDYVVNKVVNKVKEIAEAGGNSAVYIHDEKNED